MLGMGGWELLLIQDGGAIATTFDGLEDGESTADLTVGTVEVGESFGSGGGGGGGSVE